MSKDQNQELDLTKLNMFETGKQAGMNISDSAQATKTPNVPQSPSYDPTYSSSYDTPKQIDVTQQMPMGGGQPQPVPAPSSNPIPEDPNDFRNVALKILTTKCEWVRITNEKTPSRGNLVYELLINRQTIKITEKTAGEKVVFLFDMRKNVLFKDQDEQSESEWDGFVKKLNNIGKDLGSNKAQMFEKVIPGRR